MQLNERVLLSDDVTNLVKNALSLCMYSTPIQYEHLTFALSLSLSHVQSDGDLLSAKIEQ